MNPNTRRGRPPRWEDLPWSQRKLEESTVLVDEPVGAIVGETTGTDKGTHGVGVLPRGLLGYYFCEEWSVAAPIDRVWTAIRDLEDYPRWWKEFLEVKRLNDLDGVGAQVSVHAKAALPYHMYFTLETMREERPSLAIVRVWGDLNGEMRWRLQPDNGGTHLIFDESVRTGKPLLNLLAPLFKPLFAWNHKVMMASGERGLRRHLGAPE